MSDLAVYRTAGHQVLEGKPVYAGVPTDQLRSLGRSYLVFTYPPFAAILAVPLALVGWHLARLAWVAAVYLPLAVTTWFAFRPLLARAKAYQPAVLGVIVAVCMFLWPMLQEIRFGQVDIALAALCVADLGTGRPRWPRGLLIGLATAIKLTPGFFIVYLLLTGRRKAACVAAATAAGCALAAWALIPGGSDYYWTKALFDTSRLGRPGQVSDQSIRAMLLRAFAPGPLPAALWLALAAGVAVAGLAAARKAANAGNEMAAAAMVGMVAVLASPVSWIHHIVWVVVAIGAIVGDGRTTWRWLAAVVVAQFFIFVDPYSRGTPWIAAPVSGVFEQVRRDAFGIACAAVMAVLAALPGPVRAAGPGSRARAGPRIGPTLQPAIGPGRSTPPDASEPAAPRPRGPHARQPGPR